MARWRGPRKPRDPLLTSPAYRNARKYWPQLGLPCALCGRPINYDAPARLPNGRLNPWAYQLDHIVSRAEARRRGWTEEMINALTNTQPTHQGCNLRAGIRVGHKTQRVKAVRRKLIMNNIREW